MSALLAARQIYGLDQKLATGNLHYYCNLFYLFCFGPGVVDWQMNVFQFVQDKNFAALRVSANMLVCNTTARLAGVLVAVGLSQSTVV
jgi:hypothetical protein